ncbi:hypothetical protein D3C73_1540450 [compost metagenome]
MAVTHDGGVAKRRTRANPVGAIVEEVQVAIHDDEPCADLEVLTSGAERPVALAHTGIERFNRNVMV